jgi:hypothetical protein
MPSYAEHLGIDLARLEAERHHHYKPPKPQYVTKDITPPPESSEDWQPIARAANGVGYNVDTLRRWTMAGKIRWQKRKGRTLVYFPDVIRHARKA